MPAGGPYSTRFIQVQTAGAWGIYNVPGGHRAVIKCITVSNSGTAAHAAVIQCSGFEVWRGSVPASSCTVVTGLLVPAYAGEYLGAYNYDSALYTTIAGFLFSDLSRSGPPAQAWGGTDPAGPTVPELLPADV